MLKYPKVKCPKCERELPQYMGDAYDTPRELARACTYDDGCKYAPCDDDACRALVTPTTPEEWKDAAEHWQHHCLNGGCSHGG